MKVCSLKCFVIFHGSLALLIKLDVFSPLFPSSGSSNIEDAKEAGKKPTAKADESEDEDSDEEEDESDDESEDESETESESEDDKSPMEKARENIMVCE